MLVFSVSCWCLKLYLILLYAHATIKRQLINTYTNVLKLEDGYLKRSQNSFSRRTYKLIHERLRLEDQIREIEEIKK